MPKKSDCIKQVMDLAGVTEREAKEALDMVDEQKQRIRAGAVIDRAEEVILAEWAKGQADGAKMKAAAMKKTAAINILVREKLEAQMSAVRESTKGNEKKAIEAPLIGVHGQGIVSGRESADARRIGITREWLGGMDRELIDSEVPIELLSKDGRFVDDVVREMHEIKPNGNPGKTGNKKAQRVAEIFSKYAEIARTRLNAAGANIGKLAGWVKQNHDVNKLLKVGKQEWIDAIKPLLDIKRTFWDVHDTKDIDQILGETYETIVTGRGNEIAPSNMEAFTGPRNIAKALEHHRELHFADADAWLQYAKQFSHGNLIMNMMSHLDMSARKLAVMEKLGPNPEMMLTNIIDKRKDLIRSNELLSPQEKKEKIDSLASDIRLRKGPLGEALAQVLGETLIIENYNRAKVGAGVRAVMSMSKLGLALMSQLNDLLGFAMNARFNGMNLFGAYGKAFSALMEGRSTKEQRKLASQLSVIYDGMLHDAAIRWNAQDSLPGRTSWLIDKFFKYTGIDYWTNSLKSGYARLFANHVAEEFGSVENWQKIDAGLRSSLESMGFTEKHFDVIAEMTEVADDGRKYVFPEAALRVHDDAIDSLNSELIDKIRQDMKLGKSKDPDVNAKRQEQFEKRLERMRAETRKDLQTKMMSLIADQTSYAIVEPDARTMRVMHQGTRPGSFAGEAWRFVTQFKSFPISYMQRTWGGKRWARPGKRFDAIGLAHYIAGSLALGYASMTAKDFIKGKKPRDPDKIETWTAAALQSGGAGILGDFFFSKYNRFGGGPIDTVAGPTLGVAGEVIQMGSELLRGNVEAGNALKLAIDNTPFINMWYTRAALDYAVLFHIREMLSPGTLQRTEKRIKEDYGQEFIIPPSTVIKAGGGFK